MNRVGKVVATCDGHRAQMPKVIKTLVKNQGVYRPELRKETKR